MTSFMGPKELSDSIKNLGSSHFAVIITNVPVDTGEQQGLLKRGKGGSANDESPLVTSLSQDVIRKTDRHDVVSGENKHTTRFPSSLRAMGWRGDYAPTSGKRTGFQEVNIFKSMSGLTDTNDLVARAIKETHLLIYGIRVPSSDMQSSPNLSLGKP